MADRQSKRVACVIPRFTGLLSRKTIGSVLLCIT